MFDDERMVAEALALLPVVKAPDAVWVSIEASLRVPVRKERMPVWRWVLAATVVLIAVVGLWQWEAAHRVRWQVVRTSLGQAKHVESISAGEWLQTDGSSHAELRVGSIGTVIAEPGTRLRVVATKPNEHRLLLQHGEISATISAPPKLFFVETKSATAVDLGCEYKMKADDYGNGSLIVTRGWVAFDWQGKESLVPAGASCRTRAGRGPGTPYFSDAPKSLIAALDQLDFANGGANALQTIVSAARVRDTLTLWHLLSRVEPGLRPLIYERMVSFAAPPAGVTRDGALALDPQTLKLWKDELAWTW